MCWRWMVGFWADAPAAVAHRGPSRHWLIGPGVASGGGAGYNPSKPHENCPVNDRMEGGSMAEDDPRDRIRRDHDPRSPPPKGCFRTIPGPSRSRRPSLGGTRGRRRRDLRPGRRPELRRARPSHADRAGPGAALPRGKPEPPRPGKTEQSSRSAHARTVGPGRRSLVANGRMGADVAGRRCMGDLHLALCVFWPRNRVSLGLPC